MAHRVQKMWFRKSENDGLAYDFDYIMCIITVTIIIISSSSSSSIIIIIIITDWGRGPVSPRCGARLTVFSGGTKGFPAHMCIHICVYIYNMYVCMYM